MRAQLRVMLGEWMVWQEVDKFEIFGRQIESKEFSDQLDMGSERESGICRNCPVLSW